MSSRPDAILSSTDPASPLAYPASQTAVLLLDYQVFIMNRFPTPQRTTILSVAARLRDWAIAHGIRVFHCTVDMSQPPVPTSKMYQRWPHYADMLAKDPASADIVPELSSPAKKDPRAATSNEAIVSRRVGLVSVLKSPKLLARLREMGAESLILAGVGTSGAVLSTARGAPDEGFVTTVVEDGCGALEEGIHETLCRSVLPATANVILFEKLKEMWKGEE